MEALQGLVPWGTTVVQARDGGVHEWECGRRGCHDRVQRHPEALPLWTANASLLIGAARYDDALRSIDRALALDPDDYDSHRVRMMALYNAKRYEETLQEAMICRRLTKESQEIHFLESLMARVRSQMQGQADRPSSAAEGGQRRPGS